MNLKIKGWLVTEGDEMYYLYNTLPHRRTDSFFTETGADLDCSGPSGDTTYVTEWRDKRDAVLVIEKGKIENVIKKKLTKDEMQRGILEIEFSSKKIIDIKWTELKNDEIEELDENIVEKEIIATFQQHCYSIENGWIKPRNFSDIGESVAEDIFDKFTEMEWLRKEYDKTKVNIN